MSGNVPKFPSTLELLTNIDESFDMILLFNIEIKLYLLSIHLIYMKERAIK